MPVTIDVLVTGVQTPANGAKAREHIESALIHCGNDIRVQVLYWCVTEAEASAQDTNEETWLAQNASTAEFYAVVPFASLEGLQSSHLLTFADTVTAAAATGPRPRATRDLGGGVFWRGANERRVLRFIGAAFNNHRPHIALLLPMSLRGTTGEPLFSTFFPSLYDTTRSSFFRMSLYLGIDADEMPTLPRKFVERCKLRMSRFFSHSPFDLHVVPLDPAWRKDRNVSRQCNALFFRAVMDNCDFAMHVQDDARLETPGWDNTSASFLCSRPLALGAVSMTDRYDKERMRTPMVSRTHFDLFGCFYGEDCLDPSAWLWDVYNKGKYTKLLRQAHVTNTIRGTRRGRNGTRHIYAGYGKHGPAAATLDAERFQEVLRKFSAAEM